MRNRAVASAAAAAAARAVRRVASPFAYGMLATSALIIATSATRSRQPPPPRESYYQQAFDIAKTGDSDTSTRLLSLFRASAFLDGDADNANDPNRKTDGSNAWNSIGIAYMRRAKKARKGNDRFALWSIAAFELARRIDPLDRRPIEANVGLLSRDQPIIANLLANRPRDYWRASPLLPSNLVGDVALSHAKAGREDEALSYLWAGLLSSDHTSASQWLNFCIMISKARKWTSQQENRFLNTTAVVLAACEHALSTGPC